MNPTRLLGIVIAEIVGITAIHLVDAAGFPSNPALNKLTEQAQVPLNHRVSLKALDLSRAPTREELMAAGQLGGSLCPTHELKDKRREESANLTFGKAIEKWNRHEYPKAVTMLRDHLRDYPDSPWAAEAALHIGCDATYNGRYSEAELLFQNILAKQQTNTTEGAIMLVNKARLRWALVKVAQNNLDEANALFRDLINSPDWRHRTYASHWIQRLSRYSANRQALLDCGPKALAYVLKKEGRQADAKALEALSAESELGYSLQALIDLGKKYGLDRTAIQAVGSDLPRLKLPVIVQINARNPGDKGHYWVLDKLQRGKIELFDPQSGARFHQAVDEFCQEWNGNTIVFAKNGRLPGRVLSTEELEDFCGGCCGVPRPPDNTGNPGENGSGGSDACDGQGSPVWSVNVINMNLFVTDTPLWYDPPIGPPVRITLSYNSQASITQYAPFGNKWQFNCASYLTVDTAGSVLIYMPDGRYDLFSPDGIGGYIKPYKVRNTLTKIAENHFELRFPDDTVYVYDIPAGIASQQPFLVEVRDAYGQRLSFNYNANVNLTTITDAQGKIFTLKYNASGLCTNVADPFGRNACFEYDGDGNLTKITDMGGYWSSLTYDTNIYLTSIGNERGTRTFRIEPADGVRNMESYRYPPPGGKMWQNYRITVTDALSNIQEFYYSGYDGDSWHVSPREYVPWNSPYENTYALNVPKTRYEFVETSSGTRAEISRITYPAGDYIQYGYDTTTGDRISITDTHGHTWRYTYNNMGRVTSDTDAKDTITTFIYATNGVDLFCISNSLGQIHMAYNAQHDLTALTDRMTNTTTMAYNSYGQITNQVDALSITNNYIYDAGQRLIEFRRAGQTLERYTYEGIGRIHSVTDATGLTVTNDYNALNQIVRVSYPDGRFENYAYSTCCPRLLDSITDRGGRTTVFIHDALKRLTQTVNPEGGITQFDYDTNGNRTSLTDPNGNITTFAYDLDNRLIRKTYDDGKGLSFGYDQAGLLITRTNARGIVTSYAYDANHNLLTTRYSDDTPGVTNTYDSFNRLIQVIDGVGTNVYAYDGNSRLTSYDGPWANDTITYAYDVLSRQTNLLVQGGQPTGYGYDALNRLTAVRVSASTYAYTYVGANPLVQRLDRPNGSFTTYQYDGLDRLTALSNRLSNGEVVNAFSYTYNAQDLRAGETVSNGLANTFTNQHTTYDYNRLNQLLTSASPDQTFAYDGDGNMIRGFTPDGHQFAATYDADNRLTTIVFTNDQGVVSRTVISYRWDGLASKVTQYTNSYVSTSAYFVRDLFLIAEERDADNATLRRYAWGLSLGGGIGGLLNGVIGSNNHSYLYDGDGNVRTLLDGFQNVAASYSYDTFGAPLSEAASVVQPYRFSTKMYYNNLGLLDYGFRLYSHSLGRWLSRDNLEDAELLPEGPNLYTFVANDPVNNVDPAGQNIIGKVIVKGIKLSKKGYKALSKKDLVRALKEGEDIRAKSFKCGKEIAEGASQPGKKVIIETDEATGKLHIHPNPRTGGHVIWGLAGYLTFSHYAEGHGALVEGGAGLIDLVNPLSTPQDVVDIATELGLIDNGGND